MRSARVYHNHQFIGVLTEYDTSNYEFRYDERWYTNPDNPGLSLTLPKTQLVYQSNHLFPFFFNMLSEGVNKQLQCRQWKVDEADFFGLLLATAQEDTIGAITIEPVEQIDL